MWDLSNSGGAETFTKPMFFIAMHLMYKKRLNANVELPNQLPVELLVSSRDPEDNPRPVPQNPPASDPRESFFSQNLRTSPRGSGKRMANSMVSQSFAPPSSSNLQDLMVSESAQPAPKSPKHQSLNDFDFSMSLKPQDQI